ncbi:MAG: UbiA family prenyltransferase [Candidatus Omnitrophota bacterium]
MINLYRVRDWYYLLGLTVLGFIFTRGGFCLCPDLWISLFIGSSYLSYGYSFNRLCDKEPRDWITRELFLVFAPILLGFILAAMRLPRLMLPLGIAVALNTAYSLPSILWKKNTLAGIVINVYLFGCLFLIGSYAGNAAYSLPVIAMSSYMAAFFIPGQLCHELAHAEADKRSLFVIKNRQRYSAAVLASVCFIFIFSLVLKIRLSLGMFFICGHFLWAVFLWYFFKSRIWMDFSVDKARELRKYFKITGMLFGIWYLIAFLRR